MQTNRTIGALLVLVTTSAAIGACSTTITTTTTLDDGGTRPDTSVTTNPTTTTTPTTTTNPTTPPPNPTTPPPNPTTPPTTALDAGPDRRAPGPACYEEADALAIQGTSPSTGRGLCTDAQLTALQTACLGGSAAGCDAAIAANTACARCVFGALAGDNPATTPLPALIPVSADSVSPNIAACAALVIGRPDCAVALTQQVVCTSSACSTCADQASDDACTATAEGAICRTTVNAGCNTAVNAAQATWAPVCRGTTFADTYTKVARYLCGP